ncbi:hypothetical protein NFI96_026007 [Prochilodus magdalenae]|nr:hypothetical protein NFI96_026007 [Prochilodus magdalenae]
MCSVLVMRAEMISILRSALPFKTLIRTERIEQFRRLTCDVELTSIKRFHSAQQGIEADALGVVRVMHMLVDSCQDIYRSCCLRKIQKIRLDCSHPAHDLFTLLPSDRRYCSIQARTNRVMNSFYPQAIRFLNKL